ncbi:hypothetical protein WJX73_006474 [Symbiochloris irregularis]|uniref:Protein kinase domain-containing protein n=1 Tax=Symbiochloris irregularis TaxID=706552 RepID=A0AAW1P1E6_9CHLO
MASRRNRRPRDSQREGRNGEDVREHEIKGHGKRRSALSAEGSPPVRKRQRTEDDDVRIVREIRRPGVPPATSINSFVVPDRPSPPFREDDSDGHYVFDLGDNLTGRYKILSKMGEGTFGRVLECWDRKCKEYVAIKIVRNVQKYRDAAMIELEVLNTLQANDPAHLNHCVHMREWFEYRHHVCMVFEKLGLSLYDFLRKNSYKPFHVDMVRAFGRQLLKATAFLHDLTLIHTDLKPENILLLSHDYDKTPPISGSRVGRRVPRSSDIKVIDFGSATFDANYHSTIVSTRHYRAPEVILGQGWTYPCDIWSIGCILVELASGDALFQTHENMEHLAMMEAVLGPIPEHIIKDASRTSSRYFTTSGGRYRLDWPGGASSSRSVRAVEKMPSLNSLLRSNTDASVRADVRSLTDLLTRMLRYDPSQRLTAHACLQHSFFEVSQPPSQRPSAMRDTPSARSVSAAADAPAPHAPAAPMAAQIAQLQSVVADDDAPGPSQPVTSQVWAKPLQREGPPDPEFAPPEAVQQPITPHAAAEPATLAAGALAGALTQLQEAQQAAASAPARQSTRAVVPH